MVDCLLHFGTARVQRVEPLQLLGYRLEEVMEDTGTGVGVQGANGWVHLEAGTGFGGLRPTVWMAVCVGRVFFVDGDHGVFV